MHKSSIYIVSKDTVQAGMLTYLLKSDNFHPVILHPSASECFYSMEKGRIPSFIIFDQKEQRIGFVDFIRSVHSFSREISVICLLDHDDEPIARGILDSGACDIILRTGKHQHWMKELIANLAFLQKENWI